MSLDTSIVCCWDLDETLGDFRLLKGNEHAPMRRGQLPLAVRKGIRESLARLMSEGCRHCINSSGSIDYVQAALEKGGLSEYFSYIEAGMSAFGGKLYANIGKQMGMTDDDMRRRMIVIGDQGGDQPLDVPGVVFIELLGESVVPGTRFRGELIEKIIHAVQEAGQGSFEKGFAQMLADAIPQEPEEDLEFQKRIFTLDDNIRFEVCRKCAVDTGTEKDDIFVSVIKNIQAPHYLSEAELLA